KDFSAFIIDKDMPGAKVGREEHKLGLRGANTGELVFDNCEIPAGNLLGPEGGGLSIAMKTISETGRSGMAGVALGVLNACLEEAAKFACERVLYGKPISALQAIQFHLADIYSELEICKLLCYRASWMKDQGMRCDTENAMAKNSTCESAAKRARWAIEVHGSYGIMNEFKVQRLLRDATVTIPSGGTAEIGRIVISRAALAPYKKKK
ncbi:MAG: acyl-CoA dehydrogenase, partial [Thermoanaerobaculia bacterium]